MTRYQANILIMNVLSEYIATNRHIRFNQALINLGIVTPNSDDYHVEPQTVVDKLEGK